MRTKEHKGQEKAGNRTQLELGACKWCGFMKDDQTQLAMYTHAPSSGVIAVAIYYGLLNTTARCECDQIRPTSVPWIKQLRSLFIQHIQL